MNRPFFFLMGLMAVLSLSGCGKLGELERPGPDGGVDAGPEPSKTVRTVDPRDRNSDPAPSRTNPIESTNNPAASGPQGVLDDPYARPQ
jgi:predicted small lipoprotein YifL